MIDREYDVIMQLMTKASELELPVSLDNQNHLRYSTHKENYVVLSSDMTIQEIIASFRETLSYHLDDSLIPSTAKSVLHTYELMCEGCKE